MPSMAVRVARIAVPATLVGVTAIGVTAGVWGAKDAQIAYPAAVTSVPAASSALSLSTSREERASRGLTEPRPAQAAKAKATKNAKATSGKVKEVKLPTPALKVTGTKYATVGLNIRTVPTQNSKVITVVPTGTKLSITDSTYKGFRFVSYKGTGRWVKNQYLSNKKPKASAARRAAASRPPRASRDPRSSPG